VRKVWFSLPLLVVSMTIAATGVAGAHVVVEPEEVEVGGYEKFVVSVPTEKEIPTTEIRVEVPEGFTVSGVQPVPGWEYEFEEEGGVVTAISWSGGQIRDREFQEFAFQAQAPEEPGEFSFKAAQTYEDGSVVEWAGPEDSEEPASVVAVVSGESTEDHGGGSQEPAAEEPGSHAETGDTLPDSGGAPLLIYVGVAAAGALALVEVGRRLPRRDRR
jgi:uncharacterized protein YcnI